ncbi:MAG: EAL domain-containing protein [Actinomycetota bacterium]
MKFTNTHKILIVDDQPNELKILSKFLEKLGYQLVVTSDGQMAIELAAQLLPSLILLDRNMPGIDGFETYRILQSCPICQDIPVIFMTHFDDAESIVTALNLGAVDYLTKPFQQEEVLRRVQLHLKLRFLTLKLIEQNVMLTDEMNSRKSSELELRKLAQELEARVEDRTEQLSLALEELQKVRKELLAREAKLHHDRLHDALTGLPNRTWLMEQLQRTIQRLNQPPNSQYAVLSVDIDRFKVINDSLGHLVGDELLKQMAFRLQNCLGSMGKIARFGGDEFIIFLDEIQSIEQAKSVAESILEQVKVPFQLNDYEVFAGVSIGITCSTLGYQSPIEVLKDAGIAMSQAKQAGKGRYQVLTSEVKGRAIARLQLENDLRQALERQEFFLEYQPIYHLSTGDLQGFEALVRWQHPSRGRIAPTDFIPTAEEIGLIDRLGFWVLQEAARQLRDWQEKFPRYPALVMNVNLSAKQLKQAKLLQEIETIFTEMGLTSNSLKLEITESWFLEISLEEIEMLHRLREKGISLCIDDFGTGYSSLGRLQKFPVDTIKVDRSFVKRLGISAPETEIVQTIVNLAHSLGLDLVAEGIETPEQLQKLQEFGYEFGQGYVFSRPLSSQMATQLLCNVSDQVQVAQKQAD